MCNFLCIYRCLWGTRPCFGFALGSLAGRLGWAFRFSGILRKFLPLGLVSMSKNNVICMQHHFGNVLKAKKGQACCSPRGHHRRDLSRCRLASSECPLPEKRTKFSAIVFTLNVSISFVQILRSIVRAYHKSSRTISMAWRCRERMFLCRHGALCHTFPTFPWDSQRIGVTHNKRSQKVTNLACFYENRR